MTRTDRPIARWIQVFLEAQAAELDAATNTQLAYARDLQGFAAWLSDKGLHFANATRDHVESYLIDCENEGLSKATRARRLSAIKQIYRFAFEEGWRADNPAIQIKGPGRAKRLLWTNASRPDPQYLFDGTAVCDGHAGHRIGQPAGVRRTR